MALWHTNRTRGDDAQEAERHEPLGAAGMGADVESACGEGAMVAAAGRLLSCDEARLLAEEFALLLTDGGAPQKGYVMSIAHKRLLVHDRDRVRTVIQDGLRSDDAEHMSRSLVELARLLGLPSEEEGHRVADADADPAYS